MNNDSLIDFIRDRAAYYIDGSRRDERVLSAMAAVDRILFLPDEQKSAAYEDFPLSIGSGQTCSQPSMVAFMLDKLSIEKGHTVLEVGGGSGYAAAIASKLCGDSGKVYTAEIIPELAENMRKNLSSYKNIIILAEDGSAGFPESAPFDRIFLSAGVSGWGFSEDILLSQLADNGILMYPEDAGSLFVVHKHSGMLHREEYEGVHFVKLKGDNS